MGSRSVVTQLKGLRVLVLNYLLTALALKVRAQRTQR